MKPASEKWLKALLAALVTGSANSFMSALGISVGQAVGIHVTQLDLHQLGYVTLFGGIVGAAAYLKQSPVPPDDTP
jgi:hypothetical protein